MRNLSSVQTEKGLVIIDQHAAQERVHYEEYKAKLKSRSCHDGLLGTNSIHAGNDLVDVLKKSMRL